jgi:hypothetical protein
MRIDLKLLAAATAIELVLAALATFGGPHGSLGAWPWALQLPGAFVLLVLPDAAGFVWRAALIIAIQITCWYVICVLARKLYVARRGPN